MTDRTHSQAQPRRRTSNSRMVSIRTRKFTRRSRWKPGTKSAASRRRDRPEIQAAFPTPDVITYIDARCFSRHDSCRTTALPRSGRSPAEPRCGTRRHCLEHMAPRADRTAWCPAFRRLPPGTSRTDSSSSGSRSAGPTCRGGPPCGPPHRAIWGLLGDRGAARARPHVPLELSICRPMA